MKDIISVIGLGYVGCVSSACFAKLGHRVIGVDVDESKVKAINQGLTPLIEKDLDTLLKNVHDVSLLSATSDIELAIRESNISLICVGTPIAPDGSMDLKYIYGVAERIGEELAKKDDFHYILIRSTVTPGTNLKFGRIMERGSKKKRGDAFEIISNPEFLREGTAIYDFFHPPYTLIGTSSKDSFFKCKTLYEKISSPIVHSTIENAELIKIVNNAFHALKVCFANEIGMIAKKYNQDSYKLMDLFKQDTKLNLSTYYFNPGFAYGGSCLPKDLQSLVRIAEKKGLTLPLLSSIKNSNEEYIQRLVDILLESTSKTIGILGITFKKDTDDIRNSPIIRVIEQVNEKGHKIIIFDKNISSVLANNSLSIFEQVNIAADLSELINKAEVVVINHKDEEFLAVYENPKVRIIDLVKLRERTDNYEGICW